MHAPNLAVIAAAEYVRVACMGDTAAAAIQLGRKITRVASRVDAGQAQFTEYQDVLADELRALQVGERPPMVESEDE